MRERYLFERKYIRKDNELKIPSKWEKLIGEDTVKILCKEYKEISSFFSENTQYYEQEAPSNVEYMEILEMYLAGSYKSEIIIENTMKDKLFFTFYIPFFKLARYYSRRKYGDILEKYFSKGIYEELYSALACVATRVLVNEIQFLENKLVGKNANEKYSAYVKMYLSNDEYIEELFQFYPLLLRCILEKICSVVEFYHQLISRWEKNVIEIKKCINIDNTEITKIKKVGDNHRNGKHTVKIFLKNGNAVFYKPRNLRISIIYYECLNILYEYVGLSCFKYRIADFGEYGWEEEIKYQKCKNKDEVKNYYVRMGCHIALSYILDIQDFHYENLISHGEYPVFIDIEVLCGHIKKNYIPLTANEKAKLFVENSVLGSGILPRGNKEMDIFCALSGKGGIKTGRKRLILINSKTSDMKFVYKDAKTKKGYNSPQINHKEYRYNGFVDEICLGFRKSYEYIWKNNKIFEGRFQNFSSRMLYNHTQNYSKLIQLSYHPMFMTDGGERQLILSKNFFFHIRINPKNGKDLFESELYAMLKGDIPYFSFLSNKKELYMDNHQMIKEYFTITPEQYIKMRIKSLSSQDLYIQHYLLNNAIKGSTVHLENRMDYMHDTNFSVIKICKQIADYLMKIGIKNSLKTDINWIISLTGTIHISDMFLYEGIAGMIVFFAALNQVAPTRAYLEVQNILLNKLLEYTMNNSSSKAYSGAFCGEASIIYTYLVLYKISNEEKYIKYAKIHENKLFASLEIDRMGDLLYGNAGAVIIYLNMYELTMDKKYILRAEIAANYILKNLKEKYSIFNNIEGNKISRLDRGIAHGGSGYSICFTRLFGKTKKRKYLNIALELLKYDIKRNKKENQRSRKIYWCHGAAGIVLAQQEILKYIEDGSYQHIFEDYQTKISMIENNFNIELDSLCLCHGILGNIMIIEQLTGKIPCVPWTSTLSKLNYFIKKNLWTNLENGNPGFMMGLAGIGYAVLYLDENTKKFPNILKLEL